MSFSEKSQATLEHLWNLGQQHLAAGRYVPARRALESAEALAWRAHQWTRLARIYLPLLEGRRQIRYNAAEGIILITDAIPSRKQLTPLLSAPAGTILITTSAAGFRKARKLADLVERHARTTSRWLEAALILTRGTERRFASPAAPYFSAGLPITTNLSTPLKPSTDSALRLPLPAPGLYTSPPEHPIIRESLLIGWEALALKWQHRHLPPHNLTPQTELAWLRKTLRIDPACEPVTMRLIALAEAMGRRDVAPHAQNR